MAKATFTIEGKTYDYLPTFVQNDYGFDIQLNIKENDNTAFNLTDYEVRFKARKLGNTETDINTLCDVTDNSSGVAVYTPGVDDFATTGKYDVQVECSSPTLITSIELGNMIINEEL